MNETVHRVAIIGAGSWGTALSILAARRGHIVTLWSHEPEVAAAIRERRENPVYLPGALVPSQVRVTTSLEEALESADVVISAIPSHVCRSIYERMRPWLHPQLIFVSATKGLEVETQMRMSEVLREVLRDQFEPRVVVLSGPSFAQEVARGDPTAVVAASYPLEYSQLVQRLLSGPSFRIYASPDVVGVEIGGAVKNVIAIGAGVVAGLGWGNNSIAALITRGLAEMTRLVVALGGRAETMAGLAGVGDLVLTCTGQLSRNRQVGIELGRGRKLSDILANMRQVAEGVRTTRAVYRLSQRLGVEMPITASIYALLYEGRDPRDVAAALMERPLKREI
ncbi:MAG: NAD(P)-dependent glycerol-3-phosphate dehydrogenase [Blastocatellia bacterium]|nr:NAD(P)-dependent glycerol-3-phosphate dehydrogenase [Blastocatellia bacterium]MCX7752156.1 NAD(P)-dependent glycerol-3-phosphate dehydrogenase [Blastocatellia bacterium]